MPTPFDFMNMSMGPTAPGMPGTIPGMVPPTGAQPGFFDFLSDPVKLGQFTMGLSVLGRIFGGQNPQVNQQADYAQALSQSMIAGGVGKQQGQVAPVATPTAAPQPSGLANTQIAAPPVPPQMQTQQPQPTLPFTQAPVVANPTVQGQPQPQPVISRPTFPVGTMLDTQTQLIKDSNAVQALQLEQELGRGQLAVSQGNLAVNQGQLVINQQQAQLNREQFNLEKEYKPKEFQLKSDVERGQLAVSQRNAAVNERQVGVQEGQLGLDRQYRGKELAISEGGLLRQDRRLAFDALKFAADWRDQNVKNKIDQQRVNLMEKQLELGKFSAINSIPGAVLNNKTGDVTLPQDPAVRAYITQVADAEKRSVSTAAWRHRLDGWVQRMSGDARRKFESQFKGTSAEKMRELDRIFGGEDPKAQAGFVWDNLTEQQRDQVIIEELKAGTDPTQVFDPQRVEKFRRTPEDIAARGAAQGGPAATPTPPPVPKTLEQIKADVKAANKNASEAEVDAFAQEIFKQQRK